MNSIRLLQGRCLPTVTMQPPYVNRSSTDLTELTYIDIMDCMMRGGKGQSKAFAMRGASSPWPRLLAAATTLALLIAGIVGAYAHAVGHRLPQPAHAAHDGSPDSAEYPALRVDPPLPASLRSMTAEAAAACEPGHAAGADDCDHDCNVGGDGGGHEWADSDTVCHGGQAILAQDLSVSRPLRLAQAIGTAPVFHGIGPASLDRPPEALRSA